MNLGKNINKWISLSVITVLLISFSFITVYTSLSIIHRQNSVVLTIDFSSDKETYNPEKDFNQDFSNLFILDFQNLKFQNSSKKIQKKQSNFLMPRVFYDIQILPPEAQLS